MLLSTLRSVQALLAVLAAVLAKLTLRVRGLDIIDALRPKYPSAFSSSLLYSPDLAKSKNCLAEKVSYTSKVPSASFSTICASLLSPETSTK
jgi:energy-converting hydrogenase Eha subunit A